MNIAVITGSSSGLGVEFAKAVDKYYPEIDEVWLIARRRDRLEEVAKRLSKKAKVLSLDLTDPKDTETYQSALAEAKPCVKLLINNAGFGKLGNFSDLTSGQNTGMVRLNCESLTLMTALTLPFMEEGGEIINTCSIAAFAPNTRLAVYSSTKAYVMSLSRALRKELKSRKINVCAVCPGPMDTEFLPVAGIGKGDSATFDRLPRVSPDKMAEGALKASRKKRGVYTNRFFYKFYRLVAKILPTEWAMKMAAT